MTQRLVVAGALLALAACNNGASSGPDAGQPDAGVDGGHVAQASGAFLDSAVSALSGAAEPRLTRDGQGVLHALYSATAADEAGIFPVRYGQCAGACDTASSWTFVTLGDHGPAGGQARLVLLPSGGARALYFRRASATSQAVVVSAQCDGACTTSASWRTGDVRTLTSLDALAVGPEPLAADAQGHLGVALSSAAGLTFGACDADCTASASWAWLTLPGVLAEAPTLVLTASGQPRVFAGAATSSGDPTVELLSCDAACATSAAAWTTTSLFWGKPLGRQVLRADGQGRLRALFYQGATGRADVAASDHRALFAWCDAACDTQAAWNVESLGLAAHAGAAGLDLVLDGAGQATVLFTNPADPPALSLASCTDACTTATAVWLVKRVESGDDVQLAEKAPAPSCDGGTASWVPGVDVSALGRPDGGGLDLVHLAKARQQCGGVSSSLGARPRYARVAP